MSIVHHIHLQVNPNLAEWFAADPVERIVNLETTLIARKREVMILMMMMVRMKRMETTMIAKKGDMGRQLKKAPISYLLKLAVKKRPSKKGSYL